MENNHDEKPAIVWSGSFLESSVAFFHEVFVLVFLEDLQEAFHAVSMGVLLLVVHVPNVIDFSIRLLVKFKGVVLSVSVLVVELKIGPQGMLVHLCFVLGL